MKAAATLSLILVFFLGQTQTGQAQEYDDLYFTKRDRKKLKEINEIKQREYESTSSNGQSFLGKQLDQEYSTHNVSPESIARYKRSNIASSENEEQQPANPSYSKPAETLPPQVVYNNYFRDPYRYNPYNRRWQNFWAFSFGTGFGVYHPFADPFFPVFDNLWLDLTWNPFFHRYNAFPYRPFFQPIGFYHPHHHYVPVRVESRPRGRMVERGPRHSRGGTVVSSSGRSRIVQPSQAPNQPSQAQINRDYKRKQAEYLRRSQSRVQGRIYNSNTNRSTTETRNSRNSGFHNSRPSRIQNTAPSYNNQRSYTPSSGSRSRSVPSYNGGGNRSRNSYSSPSPSRNSGGSRSGSSGSGRSRGTGGGGRSRN